MGGGGAADDAGRLSMRLDEEYRRLVKGGSVYAARVDSGSDGDAVDGGSGSVGGSVGGSGTSPMGNTGTDTILGSPVLPADIPRSEAGGVGTFPIVH